MKKRAIFLEQRVYFNERNISFLTSWPTFRFFTNRFYCNTADSVASFLLTLSTQINIVFEIVFHFFYKHITFYVLKKKNKSTILARTAINRRIIYNKKRNISVRVHNIFEWLIFYLKTKLVLYIDWSYHHSISPE